MTRAFDVVIIDEAAQAVSTYFVHTVLSDGALT
jgi:superfamily I DNA and/or RNA helicase